MIPPARRGGRRRSVDVREMSNAIFYVLSTGCQWKAMPKDLPVAGSAESSTCGEELVRSVRLRGSAAHRAHRKSWAS